MSPMGFRRRWLGRRNHRESHLLWKLGELLVRQSYNFTHLETRKLKEFLRKSYVVEGLGKLVKKLLSV